MDKSKLSAIGLRASRMNCQLLHAGFGNTEKRESFESEKWGCCIPRCSHGSDIYDKDQFILGNLKIFEKHENSNKSQSVRWTTLYTS